MVQPQRIEFINDKPIKKGNYVLYWMQQSQREQFNHALEYAAQEANDHSVPLVVLFTITDFFPEANLRHYHFLISGLSQTKKAIEQRGVQLVIRVSRDIPESVSEFSKDSVMVITDCGYLGIQRLWRRAVAEKINCRFVQVESDAIVPVKTASPKQEIGARTLRSKIQKKLPDFLVPVKRIKLKHESLNLKFESTDISNVTDILYRLNTDRSVTPLKWLKSGPSEAQAVLRTFIKENLAGFGDLRNDPSKNHTSNLSPYLHFGQISPLYIALEIVKTKSPGTAAFLEEMVVRRELGFNYCLYSHKYDSFDALPSWAKESLHKHRSDKKSSVYSLEEMEHARTQDPYWNTAQREMVFLGKMHGYMRMYWGKKILEWSPTPEEAFRRALYLNNKYSLDGRDPNSFTGVAWCFGLHDRAWGEREVFGKVRYMNQNGLKRKFDMDGYVDLVEEKIADEQR